MTNKIGYDVSDHVCGCGRIEYHCEGLCAPCEKIRRAEVDLELKRNPPKRVRRKYCQYTHTYTSERDSMRVEVGVGSYKKAKFRGSNN